MPFFKTKICRNWETNGACRLGAQCGFAHGRAELRQIDAAALDAFSRPAPAAAPPKSAADKDTWDHGAFEVLNARPQRLNATKAAMRAFEF